LEISQILVTKTEKRKRKRKKYKMILFFIRVLGEDQVWEKELEELLRLETKARKEERKEEAEEEEEKKKEKKRFFFSFLTESTN